jgi:aminoglycoside phosphotransferase
MPAGPPVEDVEIPASVLQLADGARLRAVWENELGGITFEVGEGRERRFVKWTPLATGIDLAREAERMRWAAAFVTVPGVLGEGSDERGSWLITSPIEGDSAVSERWLADPGRAVAASGRGLRELHDLLPVDACPFSWAAELRLEEARRLAANGELDPGRWHPVHRAHTVDQALELVATPPPVDRLVVCHGDACSPNTILTADGAPGGHVDLGSLGVADRWADLAVATWSTTWNYGPGWEQTLLDAYGIAADRERTAYYRLLWDLGP